MYRVLVIVVFFFFFQAEDGIRDVAVTGVQTCALPISIGADRFRIIRQLLTESLGIATTGAALGILLAWRGLAFLASRLDRKSVVLGKECRSRWSPYH